MRKFTVGDVHAQGPSMTIVADYVTRVCYGSDEVLKFWIRRKWWQLDAMVGLYESRFYTRCTSEELHSDTDFLAKVGVQS